MQLVMADIALMAVIALIALMAVMAVIALIALMALTVSLPGSELDDKLGDKAVAVAVFGRSAVSPKDFLEVEAQ
mgnify:CR=1 FL=1